MCKTPSGLAGVRTQGRMIAIPKLCHWAMAVFTNDVILTVYNTCRHLPTCENIQVHISCAKRGGAGPSLLGPATGTRLTGTRPGRVPAVTHPRRARDCHDSNKEGLDRETRRDWTKFAWCPATGTRLTGTLSLVPGPGQP